MCIRDRRFWPALQAPGAARPAWLVLGALTAEIRELDVPATAADAFRAWVASHGDFAGLDYATLGTRGAVLSEPVSVAGD